MEYLVNVSARDLPRNPYDQSWINSDVLPNSRKEPTHTRDRIIQIQRNPGTKKGNEALKHGIYDPQHTKHPNPTSTFLTQLIAHGGTRL